MEPTMTFSVERRPLKEVWDSLLPLITENVKVAFERNEREFNPALEKMFYLDEIGYSAVYVLYADQKPVGYQYFALYPSLRSDNVTKAVQDAFYVTPKFAYKVRTFLTEVDRKLVQDFGVKEIWRQSTVHKNVDLIYEQGGYTFYEKNFLKNIGG